MCITNPDARFRIYYLLYDQFVLSLHGPDFIIYILPKRKNNNPCDNRYGAIPGRISYVIIRSTRAAVSSSNIQLEHISVQNRYSEFYYGYLRGFTLHMIGQSSAYSRFSLVPQAVRAQ